MILAVVLAPSGLSALTNSRLRQGSQQDSGVINNFCERLTTLAGNLDQRIAEQQAKIATKRAEIAAKFNGHRQAQNTKLTQKRTEWNVNRQAHFAKLEEKAQNDVQKQAVVDFVAAVEAALVVRRAAVDKAITDFRQAVDQIRTARQTAVDTAINTFKEAKRVAFAKVEADCVAGVNPKTSRETLRTSLKAARDKFASDRQALEKRKDQMEPLLTARREAIKEAIAEFKTALDEAKTKLKAVFPQA